jgi:hypothetical protein
MLDDAGEPVPTNDVEVWGRWFQVPANRIVAQNLDEHGAGVSTVFLGLDHDFTGTGPPVLWETLVFGGPLDGTMERYTSRADALAGHRAMCDRYRVNQGSGV